LIHIATVLGLAHTGIWPRSLTRDGSGQSTSAIKFHSQSTSAFEHLGADSHKDARL
jgi:hypothetical protein